MRRHLFALSLIAPLVLALLASQPFLPAAGQERPVATPTPGWQLFLPAVGRPAAPSASFQPASPALVRRVTEWAAPMQLSIRAIHERPDSPSGDVVYRIKDVFTTREGSWEVGSAAYGVPQWAREDYLSAAFAKGEVLAPAKSLAQMQQVIFNDHINAALCVLFMSVVLVMLFCSVRAMWTALRSGRIESTETPIVLAGERA